MVRCPVIGGSMLGFVNPNEDVGINMCGLLYINCDK